MVIIEKKHFFLRSKDVWFSDYPFELSGCDTVMFHECKNKVDLPGFKREEFTTLVIDLTRSLEDIWRDLNDTCRNNISQARRSMAKMKINEHYSEICEMNDVFRVQKGVDVTHVSVDFMKKYGTLFVAELDGKIVAGRFYFDDSDHFRTLVSVSNRLSVEKSQARLIGNINRWLTWESLVYAKEHGIKIFDLGGFYTGNVPDPQKEAINKFKKSFGGTLVTYYHYRKDYLPLYGILKKLYRFLKRRLDWRWKV